MVPYEQSERLVAAVSNKGEHHYELHKTRVLTNVARNSLVFLTHKNEKQSPASPKVNTNPPANPGYNPPGA